MVCCSCINFCFCYCFSVLLFFCEGFLGDVCRVAQHTDITRCFPSTPLLHKQVDRLIRLLAC